MQPTPTGFAAAIANRSSQNLTVTASASVKTGTRDLAAANGIAESIVIRRELSGELPDSATNTIEGAISATATITADGRNPGAPSPFSPLHAAAWLNRRLTVATGYAGADNVPAFSGTMAEISSQEDARRVTIVARDAAESTSAPVYLQPYGSTVTRLVPGKLKAHRTNTQGVITAILHGNGIRMTPAPRGGCTLSVPGVGGWLADIGWTAPLGSNNLGDNWLEAGRFGMAPKLDPTGSEIITAFPSAPMNGDTGEAHQYECFYRHDGTNVSGLLTVAIGAGAIRFDVFNGTLSIVGFVSPQTLELAQPTALSVGWHHICFQINWYDPGNALVSAWVDGVRISSEPFTLPVPRGRLESVAIRSSRVQAVNVYDNAVGGLSGPSASVMTFAPEADLSRGALDLHSIPNVDGRKSSEVLAEIASAELGMCGFSEAGRFFFKTRADLAANSTSVADWGLDLIENIGAEVNVDGVLTRATATVKAPRGAESGIGSATPRSMAIPSLIADTVLAFPSGWSEQIVRGSDPVLATAHRVSIITAPGQAWDQPVGMALCTTATGSAMYTGGLARAYLLRLDQTAWTVRVWNPHSSTLYAVTPQSWVDGAAELPFGFEAGSPTLFVNGVTFTDKDSPETVVDRSNPVAMSTWGDRVLDMGANPWRQNALQVTQFADAVLSATGNPRVQIETVTVPADPRWQIGDVVTIKDANGRLPDLRCRITTIELTISRDVESGMVGKYGLRQINSTG